MLATGLLLGAGGRTPEAFAHALVPMLGLSALSLAQLARLGRTAPA